MKNFTLFAVALATLTTGNVWAQESVNLTPIPKEIQVGQGTLTLPQQFTINLNGLPDSVRAEAEKFVEDYTKVSGAEVRIVEQGDASSLIGLNWNSGANKMGPEAYKLKITEQDIAIEAETTRGFYYAFQSLKKLLPPCVMAGVRDPKVTTFILPVVDINDAPKFQYRGYMLDVCRHFFTVEEIKRILDVMSYYKMNKFHWHLTEDQGWRVEIKKYPKLTSVASVRDFSWNTEYKPGGQRYRTYEPYGPYFYTQEQIREVVQYAQDRHIDIIPEVDMPGHFSAAMAAYPEFSCNPTGNHTIPCDGGIYSDVLNVGDPKAVQFAMDIMDELMDLFPYPYFHIGGDECPTTAWEGNAQCQKVMEEMGYTHPRQLQSRFIHQLAEHAAKRGRKLYVWNEAISASGADLNVIKEAGATIMCWTGADAAAKNAANLGLNNVLTPQFPLYINRKAGTDPNEPHAVGGGTDATLEQAYAYNPGSGVAANLLPYYTGVQGSFWTEHVSEAQHVEYLTFPRLMAVAETGWSPTEKKNFTDFCNRMKKDTVLLNYNNYQYAPYYLKEQGTAQVVLPVTSTEGSMVWYRLVTMATGDRDDKCLELLREGAPQIAQYSGNGAAAGRLWSGAMVAADNAAYDYQWWALIEDPQNKGKYALVCKAAPNGSVNPEATANSNSGRWVYDDEVRHYNFTLETTNYYGKNGDNYYYGIKSDQYANNYFNMGAGGQGYAINLWGDPRDGNGGLWEFQPLDRSQTVTVEEVIDEAKSLLGHAAYYETGKPEIGKYDQAKGQELQAAIEAEEPVKETIRAAIEAMEASLGVPQDGDQIRIVNSVDGSYKGLSIAEKDGQLRTADSKWASDIWVVENSADRTFTLKNLESGQYINGNANPLTLGAEKTAYKYTFNAAEQDFTLATSENKALFPVSTQYVTNPGCIYVDGVRAQGAAWTMDKVWQIKYTCVDEQGNSLGTYCQAVKDGADVTCEAPEIQNFEVVGYGEGAASAPEFAAISQNETVRVVYRRTAYSLTFEYRDERGNLLGDSVAICKVQEATEIAYPQIDYYTFKESTLPQGAYTPVKDEVVTVTYATEALYCGFKATDRLVTELESGKQYLFYNAQTNDARNGFINVDASGKVLTSTVTEGSPAFVWELAEGEGDQFKVKTSAGKYLPALAHGGNITVGSTGDTFTFTLNDDQETWTVRGTNGEYWNGNKGSMTGWSAAHPYKIYTLVAVPYFEVKCSYVDEDGNALTEVEASADLVKAGDTYEVYAPELEGYEAPVVNVTAEQLAAVGENLEIQVVYKRISTGIGQIEATGKSDGKLYDLNGRELKKATVRGVYIENGQKVIK